MTEVWMENLKRSRQGKRWQTKAEHEESHESALVNRCRKIAKQMNVYLEFAGQRKAKGAGNTVGLPDAFLYVAGWCHPIEFKTEEGKLSQPQINCMVQRLAQGVRTHVLRDEDAFISLVNSSRRLGCDVKRADAIAERSTGASTARRTSPGRDE